MLKELRRKRLRSAPFSEQWLRIIQDRWPFYRRLPENDRRELQGHIQVFLAEKRFEGCDGLLIEEEHRVCIAAQACLLLLHRETDYYPDLRTILVYPRMYVVPTTRHLGGGVMQERHESRLGESWREGAVVLAWDAVCNGMAENAGGHNVVLHEFAHQLDYEDGFADGAPLLGQGESLSARRRRYADWSRVMQEEYERLRTKAQRGQPDVLREYGATNPAEFFAVATESFFCKPFELRGQHPALYEQMRWYYRQDPAEW
ncbi:MAG TPA: M90 family metallopeptidase [Alphaproteobacteria bacterium]|nr:M90 family metallopeptidase [Alphaproteobacteria bacterium]